MAECSYCLGRGTIYGPGFFSYLRWRLTGRMTPTTCPECKGSGEAQPGQCTYENPTTKAMLAGAQPMVKMSDFGKPRSIPPVNS